jgi:hypothetical protein
MILPASAAEEQQKRPLLVLLLRSRPLQSEILPASAAKELQQLGPFEGFGPSILPAPATEKQLQRDRAELASVVGARIGC